MRKKLIGSLLFLLIGLGIGCKKDPGALATVDEKMTAKQQVTPITYNPYSLANMRKAAASLLMKDVQLLTNNQAKYAHGKILFSNNSEVLTINKSLTAKECSELVEKELLATHYYIKFMPANETDLAKLKADSNLMIYPFPLDAAVSQYSGNYRDPSLPAGVPTYQYASVPVNYVLPNVPFVKLADLFLPDESSNAKPITIKGAGNSSYSVLGRALVSESLCGESDGTIKEELNEEECNYGGGGPSTGTGAPPGEWRPSGRITVNDEALGVIGVEGIKVRARRWFTTYTGITDANGYYHVDGTYTRPANYWFQFERYDFSVNDHGGGPQEVSGGKMQAPWNTDLTGYNKFCATIFRAAFHYYYKDIQGLRRPPQNSFWATQVKLAAFNWYENSAHGSMWENRPNLLGSLINIFHPNRSSMDIYATTIHELTHAVHWDMSASLGGYTTFGFTDDNVRESWSRGVQWSLTKMVYPSYRGGDQIIPDGYTNIVIDMIDEDYDINNEGISNANNLVRGYNIVQIQDAITNALNGFQWKTNLKNNYANSTEQNLDLLFTSWSF